MVGYRRGFRRKLPGMSGTKAVIVPVLFAGIAFAAEAGACENERLETVTVEEFIAGGRLADLTEELIARGRKEAVQQAATAHVRVSSSERIDNDTLEFKSIAKERFRGSVLSHKVLNRTTGRIGNRETLKFDIEVTVCVQPWDQVWYIVQQPFVSEKEGRLARTANIVSSPSRQLQIVRPQDASAGDASYVLHGMVFSEDVRLADWTNDREIAQHRNCVENARQSSRMMSDLFSNFTGFRLHTGNAGHRCGPPPRRRTGKMASWKAVFSTKICDSHMDTCTEHRQPHSYSQVLASRTDMPKVKAFFYRDGFGLSSTIALNRLMTELGIADHTRSKPSSSVARGAASGSKHNRSRPAYRGRSEYNDP